MESYKIIPDTPKPFIRTMFSWSEDRGIHWEKMKSGDSFFVNNLHEAGSVVTCFRYFQKAHPTLSKGLRIVRRKEEGTDRYQLFFVTDDGSTKSRGARKSKRISPEHRAKIKAAHIARYSAHNP
jgi:hypothetical protein